MPAVQVEIANLLPLQTLSEETLRSTQTLDDINKVLSTLMQNSSSSPSPFAEAIHSQQLGELSSLLTNVVSEIAIDTRGNSTLDRVQENISRVGQETGNLENKNLQLDFDQLIFSLKDIVQELQNNPELQTITNNIISKSEFQQSLSTISSDISSNIEKIEKPSLRMTAENPLTILSEVISDTSEDTGNSLSSIDKNIGMMKRGSEEIDIPNLNKQVTDELVDIKEIDQTSSGVFSAIKDGLATSFKQVSESSKVQDLKSEIGNAALDTLTLGLTQVFPIKELATGIFDIGKNIKNSIQERKKSDVETTEQLVEAVTPSPERITNETESVPNNALQAIEKSSGATVLLLEDLRNTAINSKDLEDLSDTSSTALVTGTTQLFQTVNNSQADLITGLERSVDRTVNDAYDNIEEHSNETIDKTGKAVVKSSTKVFKEAGKKMTKVLEKVSKKGSGLFSSLLGGGKGALASILPKAGGLLSSALPAAGALTSFAGPAALVAGAGAAGFGAGKLIDKGASALISKLTGGKSKSIGGGLFNLFNKDEPQSGDKITLTPKQKEKIVAAQERRRIRLEKESITQINATPPITEMLGDVAQGVKTQEIIKPDKITPNAPPLASIAKEASGQAIGEQKKTVNDTALPISTKQSGVTLPPPGRIQDSSAPKVDGRKSFIDDLGLHLLNSIFFQ